MKKNYILLLALCLTLISCGKNDSSSKNSSENATEYFPIGLSDKLISINGEDHAPMNFLSQELTMTFDSKSQKATGKSSIKFQLHDSGRPYFELMASVKNLKVNGKAAGISTITDPDGQNQTYISVNETLPKSTVHELSFDYELPSGRVSFTSGGVRFLTDMTDLNGKFFEYWGPCGFEGDAFSMKLVLQVLNSTSTHSLRTNGSIKASSDKTWSVSYPDYYSKSSFYIHLTNQVLPEKKFTYQGIEKEIPVEVYGLTTALVNSAVSELPKLFKELEGDYGAYPHEKFLVYMNDRSGGMEYVGATITSLGSLDHELLHSWFGRSIIPADGRSGWIDEAMASWRDYGYTRAASTLGRTPTNLANYSAFRKSTPRNSYVDGRGLFAELDREFSTIGGLKFVMKALFKTYKNRAINNEEFWNFLESHTNVNLVAYHERYALGDNKLQLAAKGLSDSGSKHPTPLTEEEILRLR